MAERFQSVWITLLIVSITMILLQPLKAADDMETEVRSNCKKYLSGPDVDPDKIQARCDTFWDTFTSAFVGKRPETVTPESYRKLIEAEPFPALQNKFLFYSGTLPLLRWLTENHRTGDFFHIWMSIFKIVQETSYGEWCGKQGSTEIFNKGCVESDVNPVMSYWKGVSAAFAEATRGYVTVLLNGEQEPYHPESVLATDEVPNFNFNLVTELRVLLVNQKDEDTCKKESLEYLKRDMKQYASRYRCKYMLEADMKNLDANTWWDKAKP